MVVESGLRCGHTGEQYKVVNVFYVPTLSFGISSSTAVFAVKADCEKTGGSVEMVLRRRV